MKNIKDELIKRLSIDKSFGILTRNAIEEKTNNMKNFDCVVLDINNLKSLNSLLGYNKVNSIIKNVFNTFKFNKGDIVGRMFFGDEIIIISKHNLQNIMDNLRIHFHKHNVSFKYAKFVNINNIDSINMKVK